MVAADIVEIDVDPLGRGVRQRLDDRPGLVVDRRVGAEREHPFAFVGAAGRADHIHALGLGDLHHRRSDRAGGGRDEDDVALLRLGDPEQPEIGGAAGEAEIAEPLMVLDRQRRHLVERLGRPRRRLAPAEHVEDGVALLEIGRAALDHLADRAALHRLAEREGRARRISRRSSARAYRGRPTATCSRPGPSRPEASGSGASLSAKLSIFGSPCGRDIRCQARVVVMIFSSVAPLSRQQDGGVKRKARGQFLGDCPHSRCPYSSSG